MTELVRYVQRLNAWRNPSVAEREEYPLYPLPWQEVSLTDLRQSPDTLLEEEVIVREVLDLNSRGFPPRYRDVEDVANRLRTVRAASRVGQR